MYKSNITDDYIDKIVVREKAVAMRTVTSVLISE